MPTPTKKRQTINNRAKTGLTRLSDQAIQTIKEAVEAKDVQASIAVLNWVVPKPKPVNGEAFNLKQDISQMTLVEQLNCINHAVVTGECSMEAADMVLGILLKSRQLLESSDFESRLRALENGDGFNV